jgi:hypothetical protein
MNQHAAPSAPSRSVLPATLPSEVPLPARGHKLVEGVAAQDALVALFDGGADEESLEAPAFN